MQESHIHCIIRIQELSELLVGSTEIDTVQNILNEITLMLGFDYFTYVGGLVFAGQRFLGWQPNKRPLSITNIPDEFYKQYSLNRLDRYDPVLKYTMGTVMPGLWSKIYDLSPIGKKEKEFVSLSFDFDMRQGLAFPIHGPGNDFGVFSMAHAKEGNYLPIPEALIAVVSLILQRIHVLLREQFGTPATATYKLSPREVDVLYWTAEGKSAWEIGQILTLSERTIEQYLNSAKQKLGASNKFEAIARVMTIRYQEPL